jgi:hypothetical protein
MEVKQLGRRGTDFEVVRVFTPVQECMTKALEIVRDLPESQINTEGEEVLKQAN